MKVSILLITFNHALYIEEAIKSILMQKHEYETEIILLDDCSTDKTLSIASELLLNRSNVQVISNELNLGITKNYQKGFSLCKGEYVFVLEGDDYWIDPFKIKKQVEFLDNNPLCIMCFHPFYIEKNDSKIFQNPFESKYTSSSDLFTIGDLILNEGLIANFSVCCYRKSALDKLPQNIYELVTYDWMINISVAQYGFLGRLNSIMSVYRLSETGVWSNKLISEKLKETMRLIPQYDKALNFKYTEFFNAKINLLAGQIKSMESTSWKLLIPPVLVHITKLIFPPALLNLIRRK